MYNATTNAALVKDKTMGGRSRSTKPEKDAIRVAVRVRPFSEREINEGAQCIVRMEGNSTIISDPSGKATMEEIKDFSAETASAWQTRFTFDRCFWSLDESQSESNNGKKRADCQYATQRAVFDTYGPWIIENAIAGFNCSLFAYGQTGSGKTHTMMGDCNVRGGAGFIPRLCNGVFDAIKSHPDQFHVEASYFEIYNERVFDLLNPGSSAEPGASLRVREHPKTGVYVEDLLTIAVSSYTEIQELINQGSLARRVGETQMNKSSSRSHAIFQLILHCKKSSGDSERFIEQQSRLYLVDLAGSERVSTSGATGTRLKEAANINKSLSALSDVIKALTTRQAPAEKQSSSREIGASKSEKFIPYRNSSLTWLLKESLGGNAKTVMLATLSPDAANYAETLSTLKYAERAKKIVNKARVNKESNTALVETLQLEIQELRNALAKYEKSSGMDEESSHKRNLLNRLSSQTKLVNSLSTTWEEKREMASSHFDILHEQNQKLKTKNAQMEKEMQKLKQANAKLESRETAEERRRQERSDRYRLQLTAQLEKRKLEQGKHLDVVRELETSENRIQELQAELEASRNDKQHAVKELQHLVAHQRDNSLALEGRVASVYHLFKSHLCGDEKDDEENRDESCAKTMIDDMETFLNEYRTGKRRTEKEKLVAMEQKYGNVTKMLAVALADKDHLQSTNTMLNAQKIEATIEAKKEMEKVKAIHEIALRQLEQDKETVSQRLADVKQELESVNAAHQIALEQLTQEKELESQTLAATKKELESANATHQIALEQLGQVNEKGSQALVEAKKELEDANAKHKIALEQLRQEKETESQALAEAKKELEDADTKHQVALKQLSQEKEAESQALAEAKKELEDANTKHQIALEQLGQEKETTSQALAEAKKELEDADTKHQVALKQLSQEKEAESQALAEAKKELEDANTKHQIALEQLGQEKETTSQALAEAKKELEDADTKHQVALKQLSQEKEAESQALAEAKKELEDANTKHQIALEQLGQEKETTSQALAAAKKELEDANAKHQFTLKQLSQEKETESQALAEEKKELEDANTKHQIALEQLGQEKETTSQALAAAKKELEDANAKHQFTLKQLSQEKEAASQALAEAKQELETANATHQIALEQLGQEKEKESLALAKAKQELETANTTHQIALGQLGQEKETASQALAEAKKELESTTTTHQIALEQLGQEKEKESQALAKAKQELETANAAYQTTLEELKVEESAKLDALAVRHQSELKHERERFEAAEMSNSDQLLALKSQLEAKTLEYTANTSTLSATYETQNKGLRDELKVSVAQCAELGASLAATKEEGKSLSLQLKKETTRMQELEARMEILQASLASERKSHAEDKLTISELEEEGVRLLTANKDHEAQADESDKIIADLQNELRKLEERIQSSEAACQGKDGEMKQLQADIVERERNLKGAEEKALQEVSELRERLETSQASLNTSFRKLQQTEESTEVILAQKDLGISRLQERIELMESEVSSAMEDVRAKTVECEQLRESEMRGSQTASTLEFELMGLQEKLQIFASKDDTIEERVQMERDSKEEALQQVKELSSKLEIQGKTIKGVQAQLEKSKAESESLNQQILNERAAFDQIFKAQAEVLSHGYRNLSRDPRRPSTSTGARSRTTPKNRQRKSTDSPPPIGMNTEQKN